MHVYSVGLLAAEAWWNSLTAEGQAFYRGWYFMKHGTYVADDVIAYWAVNNLKDIDMKKLITPEFADTASPLQKAKQEARSGIDITGKKIRIVFAKGRDLNIFNVQTMNVDGQWWRITDGNGVLHIVDPKKVNYTETK